MKNPLVRFLPLILIAFLLTWATHAAVVADAFAKKVTFTASGYAGASTLTNFPVLVRLSTAVSGFNYSDFSFPATGADLRFTNANGVELPFEIETWNSSGTSLVWVRVPELTAGTAITAYYGNATPADAPASSNVWTSYAGVWHLDDADSTGLSHDSGPYAIDGANAAATTRWADGAVGACRRISDDGSGGTTGGITVPGYTNLAINASSVFSVGGWLRHKDQAPNWDHVFYKKTFGKETSGFGSEFYSGAWCLDVYGSADDGDNSSSRLYLPGAQSDYAWFHLVLVFNGAAVSAYTNGVLALSTTRASVVANNDALAFGTDSDQSDICWKGEMDELRVSPAACSADWIGAEYASVSNLSFLVAGTVQTIGSKAPVLDFVNATGMTAATANLQATLSSTGIAAVTLTCAYGTSADALSVVETWTDITTNGGVYAHALTGLSIGTTYYYAFTASCAAGDGTAYVAAITNSFVTGTTVTWTGAAGTDWNDRANWDVGVVPTDVAVVVIPAGARIAVAGAALAASIAVTAGSTSIALADGASLAVGGGLAVTGPGTFAVTGGIIRVEGDLSCGRFSGGVEMTVQDTTLAATNLYVGYLQNGSCNSLLVTNAAVIVSNRIVVGLANSTTAPASSNLLLVAKGGRLVAQSAYVAANEDTAGRALANYFVIDGGVVTNSMIGLAQGSGSSTVLGGYLEVKNGGHLELTAPWGNTPALYFRGTLPMAICGISVVNGGQINASSRMLYGTAACSIGTPYFVITNGIVTFGYQSYIQGANMFVLAGADARFLTYDLLDFSGAFNLIVPPEGWSSAPFVFSEVPSWGFAVQPLVVDASGYAGTMSTSIPLLRATGSGAQIPTNFVTGATIVLPTPKWKGELVFNTASNILSLALTQPPGFVIRICDTDIDVPYDWATNACPSIVATDTAAISNALVSVGENGLNRWQSYALGLDPNDASSVVLCDAKQDAAASSATFYVRNVVPVSNDVFKIVYVLEGSTDGLTWPYESTSETNALSLVLPSAYRLFRLRTDIVLK